MSPERKSISTELREFQRNIHAAFQQLITEEKYHPMWERFRHAYEYRRQFDWLGEADNRLSGIEGLVYALYCAATLYKQCIFTGVVANGELLWIPGN